MELIENNIAAILIIPALGSLAIISMKLKEEMAAMKTSMSHLSDKLNQIQITLNQFMKTEVDELKELVRFAKESREE